MLKKKIFVRGQQKVKELYKQSYYLINKNKKGLTSRRK